MSEASEGKELIRAQHATPTFDHFSCDTLKIILALKTEHASMSNSADPVDTAYFSTRESVGGNRL